MQVTLTWVPWPPDEGSAEQKMGEGGQWGVLEWRRSSQPLCCPRETLSQKGQEERRAQSLEATVLAQLCCVTSDKLLNLHVSVSSFLICQITPSSTHPTDRRSQLHKAGDGSRRTKHSPQRIREVRRDRKNTLPNTGQATRRSSLPVTAGSLGSPGQNNQEKAGLLHQRPLICWAPSQHQRVWKLLPYRDETLTVALSSFTAWGCLSDFINLGFQNGVGGGLSSSPRPGCLEQVHAYIPARPRGHRRSRTSG